MDSIHTNKHLKALLKGSIISLLGTGCVGVLNYFVRRELALSMEIIDFGFIYSVMALCNIFLAYLDMGLGQSATILISKALTSNIKSLVNKYYIQVLLIKFLLGILIFIILSATYKFWLSDFFKYNNPNPYFIVLTLIIIQPLSSSSSAVITALKKFGILNLGVAISPATVLLIIFFFNPKHNIIIYALAFPIGTFIMFVFWFVAVAIFGYLPKIENFKAFLQIQEIYHLSKWIAISTLAFITMYYMDSLMLTWLDGLKAVGLYNIALPLMQIAQSLLVIPTVFLPIVSNMWQENNEEEISLICNIITELTFYILCPLACSIILLAKYIISSLFSYKFIAAAPALMILFIGSIFYSLANFYIGTLNAGKFAKYAAISAVIGALLNVFLNLFLIPYLSITGAATATALSYIFVTAVLYYTLKRNLTTFFINIKSITSFFILGIGFIVIVIFIINSSYYCLFTVTISIVIINIAYFLLTIKTLKRYYFAILNLLRHQD